MAPSHSGVALGCALEGHHAEALEVFRFFQPELAVTQGHQHVLIDHRRFAVVAALFAQVLTQVGHCRIHFAMPEGQGDPGQRVIARYQTMTAEGQGFTNHLQLDAAVAFRKAVGRNLLAEGHQHIRAPAGAAATAQGNKQTTSERLEGHGDDSCWDNSSLEAAAKTA